MINSRQIEHIELIPESKITMMNGKFYIVKENKRQIVAKIIRFNQEILKGFRGEAR